MSSTATFLCNIIRREKKTEDTSPKSVLSITAWPEEIILLCAGSELSFSAGFWDEAESDEIRCNHGGRMTGGAETQRKCCDASVCVGIVYTSDSLLLLCTVMGELKLCGFMYTYSILI